jgi:hypothetical protein
MRTLLATMPLLLAAPLSAHASGSPGAAPFQPQVSIQAPPNARPLHEADKAIREGRRDGQLSRSEAKRLRREERILASVSEREAGDGLAPGEAADLDFRSHVLVEQVDAARLKGQAKR